MHDRNANKKVATSANRLQTALGGQCATICPQNQFSRWNVHSLHGQSATESPEVFVPTSSHPEQSAHHFCGWLVHISADTFFLRCGHSEFFFSLKSNADSCGMKTTSSASILCTRRTARRQTAALLAWWPVFDEFTYQSRKHLEEDGNREASQIGYTNNTTCLDYVSTTAYVPHICSLESRCSRYKIWTACLSDQKKETSGRSSKHLWQQ